MKSIAQSFISIASPMVFYFVILFALVAVAIDVWSANLGWGTLRLLGVCFGVMIGCLALLLVAKIPIKKALLAGLENIFWFV